MFPDGSKRQYRSFASKGRAAAALKTESAKNYAILAPKLSL
jgi:hypothetical protein